MTKDNKHIGSSLDELLKEKGEFEEVNTVVRSNLNEIKKIHSDLKRLDAMKDEDIDYSEIPELDESFFEKATVRFPKK
jgi:hypothetical protein